MAIATEEDPDVIDGVYYQSEDGKPMGLTIVHVVTALELFQLLRNHYFRVRADVFVSCDQFWYWEEGNPKARISPDIMVCFGVDGAVLRRSYLQWRENNVVPSVCFEFLSRGTWRKNLTLTKDIYEQRGVAEYFAFDPDYKYVKTGLKGFRLKKDKYVEIVPDDDGSMLCKSLNFRLAPVGRSLRLADPKTGELLLTEVEKVSLADRKAEDADRKAKEEHRRAEELQKEVDLLRAQMNPKKHRTNGAHPRPSSS